MTTSSPSRGWIVTHAANGAFITYNRLHEYGLCVDECHYTCDAAVVYTYFHIKAAAHLSTVMHFLGYVRERFNVVLTEVFGYCTVVPFTAFRGHIGAKVLSEHYIGKHPNFVACTDGDPGVVRGFLFGADKLRRLTSMIRGRSRGMADFFDSMVRELRDNNKTVEYDVVKKRRRMEDQDAGGSVDTCPEALKIFEDFESSVLLALKAIDRYDTAFKCEEVIQLEDELGSRLNNALTIPRDMSSTDIMRGGVYVAKSRSVGFPKIGATRRTFEERHRELRVVPSPFLLVYWVPSAAPFKTENAIHKHFNANRIREHGGNSEFFDVDLRVIGQHLKETYPCVVDNLDVVADALF